MEIFFIPLCTYYIQLLLQTLRRLEISTDLSISVTIWSLPKKKHLKKYWTENYILLCLTIPVRILNGFPIFLLFILIHKNLSSETIIWVQLPFMTWSVFVVQFLLLSLENQRVLKPLIHPWKKSILALSLYYLIDARRSRNI